MKEILEKTQNKTQVTMQIFQRSEDSVLCGINEVLELFNNATGYMDQGKWHNCRDELHIESLTEGDSINAMKPVMHITGPYVYFAHLESLYLGILARRTLVASNSRRAVKAASGKPVYCFADRFDSFLNQEGDGYAAHIGGISGICTPAHGFLWHGKPVGTIPHSFIAVCGGNTVSAAKQFSEYFPRVPLIVLVDYQNDCLKTSIEVARSLKGKLWGVRLDTSKNMVDHSLRNVSGAGVTVELVSLVRKALDSEGFQGVRIAVSGGFDPEKINLFENHHVSVDVYGTGSSLLKGNNDFTADVVKVNGTLQSKAGREYIPI